MVDNPVQTLKRVYEKLEMPVDYYAIKSMMRHLSEVPSGINTNSYMSTYRGPDHNMNMWKVRLKPNLLQLIESKCADTIETFGYKIVHSRDKV